MLTPKTLTPGKKYLVWLAGITTKFVAECLAKQDRYGEYYIKILSEGIYQNKEFKGEYIPIEEYNESQEETNPSKL
jgi:hypothetical protein